MREEVKSLLTSPEASRRIQGWSELHDDCVTIRWRPSREDFLFLGRVYREEDDDDVWRFATTTFTEVLAALLPEGLPAAAPAPKQGDMVPSLYDWILDPFRGTSAVFGTAADRHLRDGMALLELRGYLSVSDFPKTDFVLVPLNQPQWEAAFHQHTQFQAIMLVGRIGLFGQDALRHWTYNQARFDFFTHHRPADCQPHALHEQYHCIVDREADDEEERYHRTKDDGGERTDFALVQRYTVEYSGGRLVVLHIAGNTSLGTLGSARWVTSWLKRQTEPDGAPIPSPANLNWDTPVEALLEVRAGINMPVWAPSRIKLLTLTTDRATWSKTNQRRHTHITLRCEDGDPHRPLGVLFGQEEEPMDAKSQMFRLLVASCLLSQQADNRKVDLDRLANDAWVWGNVDIGTKLRGKLASLKHAHKKLRDLLSIGPEVHFHVDLKIASVQPVPVGVAISHGRKPREPRVARDAGPRKKPR